MLLAAGSLECSVSPESPKPQRQIHFRITFLTTPEAQVQGHGRPAASPCGFFPEYSGSTPKNGPSRLKVTLLKLAQRTLGEGIEDVLIQSYIEM